LIPVRISEIWGLDKEKTSPDFLAGGLDHSLDFLKSPEVSIIPSQPGRTLTNGTTNDENDFTISSACEDLLLDFTNRI
jgi:hypothetical protein